MDEETIDTYLAQTAIKNGWAENKLLLAARILKVFSTGLNKKEREIMKEAIRILESYKLE